MYYNVPQIAATCMCVYVTNGRSANITVEARFVSFDFDAIHNENDKKLSN